MAYTGYTLPNPLAAPGTLAPSGSLAETLPLPPPGRAVDGTCDLHPPITGLHAAKKHVYTILPAGTISTDGIWTLTFTPTKTINGLPVADALAAVSISATVGVTETADALSALLVTAYNAAKTIATAAGVTSATRILEIIGTLTNSSGTLTATGAIAGETFSVALTPESGGSSTITNTVDASGTDMRIGVFVVKTGLHTDGVTPLVRAAESGDAAADIIGLVADGGTRIKPIDSDAGYSARYYPPGRTVPIVPLRQGHGQWTAYAEAAVDDGDDVWVRVVATGSEIFGAVNDTPDEAVQICTVTPTAEDATVYQGFVQVYDRDGKVVDTFPFYYLSTSDPATATQITTGIKADLTTPIADYSTVTGTTTIILTAVAGYTVKFVSTGAGVLEPAYTGGTIDHVKIPDIKFSRTTTAAGSAAIQF